MVLSRRPLLVLLACSALAAVTVAPRKAEAVGASVTVTPEALSAYDDLRLRRKYHWVIFRIENKERIVVDSTLSVSEKFDYRAFKQKVSDSKEPRFIVLDYRTTTVDNREVSKLFLIHWSPDSASVSAKMLYASAKEDLKKQLAGIAKSHQANGPSDLEESALRAVALQ